MQKNVLPVVLLIVGIVIGFGAGFMLYSGPNTSTIMTSITARGYILVGTNTPYAPFEVYNTTTSEYEGFEIELMERIAASMGLTVVWRDMDFNALVGACKVGTVDMIVAAMFVSADRTSVLPASMPYFAMDMVIVVNNSSALTITSLEDLDGLIVGVQTGTVEDEELTAADTGDVDIDIRRYAAVDLMFTDLDTDAIDALYIDEPVFVEYSEVYDMKTVFSVQGPPVCAYVRPDGTDLLGGVNLALYTLLTNGTLDAMSDYYFL